jgi:hypothetical protein
VDWSNKWEAMMRTVGAYEAKTHLPKLIDLASRGERVVIERHGVPVGADASWLDLAMRRGLPLATSDATFARTAAECAVPLFGG